jgi:hypothetical protein
MEREAESEDTEMLYRLLADVVVVVHMAFVVFAVFGGFLVLRWKAVAWGHVLAVLWAALVEWADWVCPLTPLENWLREQGGALGYRSDFVEHYLVPVLYPSALTRSMQVVLGSVVIGLNVGVYGWVWYTRRKRTT